jgi:hypothetical protein
MWRTVRGAALALTLTVVGPGLARAELTGAERLAAVYDDILAARFAEAERGLAAACPPVPVEACGTLRSAWLWWQIALDPADRRLDEEFETLSQSALDAAEAWTRREPQRAEAWFYLAGAHAPRVQWLILRNERLAAARAGSRVKQALERALERDPALHDAYFGIGLYHYYADVAPAALRMLRWLLLLPGGDRERGLAEMLKARGSGVLLRDEADYQLHFIYLWYEGDTARALELLRGLDARYPSNPLFLQRIAAVQSEYLRDDTSAEDTWRELLERALTGRIAPAAAAIAEGRSRIALAASRLAQNDSDGARDHLERVIAAGPRAPFGAVAHAHLLLGDAHFAVGDRDRSRAEYRRAIEAAPEGDPGGVRVRARDALRRNF